MQLIKFILYYGFRLIDFIFPKKNDLVLFSQANNLYTDNSKILFKYMLNENNITVKWLASNKTVYDRVVKDVGKANVINQYTFKGFIIFLKAGKVVLSHGYNDFGYYKSFSSRKKTIMLWHAIMIKKYGIFQNSNLSEKYSIQISSSEIDNYFTQVCQNMTNHNVVTVGLPRNDYLISIDKKKINHDFTNKLNDKKVILYAPTYRDYGVTEFFPFGDSNLETLKNTLIEQDAVLLFRPHPNDKENLRKLTKLSSEYKSAFKMASNKEIQDVNELLPFVDVIVTDYSSIYIDLLLKDIPSVFIPYDLEEYDKVRGLAYDYNLVTPGPKVFTQIDFILSIKDALRGAYEYKEQRDFVKKMFHKYEDGNACKRIAKVIRELD